MRKWQVRQLFLEIFISETCNSSSRPRVSKGFVRGPYKKLHNNSWAGNLSLFRVMLHST